MTRDRCHDCGMLHKDGHEQWCVRYRPPQVPIHRSASTQFAWHGPWYNISDGPLPTMNVINYNRKPSK